MGYPDNVLVRVQRVRALLRHRRYGDALRELDRIETIDTDNRLRPQALQYWRRARERHPGNKSLKNKLDRVAQQ